MTSIYKYLELLLKFKSLPVPVKSESIFDIAGYPHYENVSSNILAFYLNPNKEHGLGDLLLSCLMNLSGGDEYHGENIQIDREVRTSKGGRIDIVIETGSQVIGIENKIFHGLNNCLADYSETLDNWAKEKEKRVVKIILSTRKEQEFPGFVCVTYEDFWSKIRKCMGGCISTSSQKWILYLVDFMYTIDKLKGGENMKIDEMDQFLIVHEDIIHELISKRDDLLNKLYCQVEKLRQKLEKEKPAMCNQLWIYRKSYLVHDFELSSNSIALDLSVSLKGWRLELLGRNSKSRSYLDELLSVSPLCEQEIGRKEKERYILEKYCLSTDLEEIKSQLLKWVNLLIQSESNKKATNSERAPEQSTDAA